MRCKRPGSADRAIFFRSETVIETVVSAAKSGGLAKRHEYRLKDGWQGVLIVSTLANESAEPKKVTLTDGWTQMKSKGSVNGVNWADAVDPSDKCGYAHAWVAEGGAAIPGQVEKTLKPGESIVVARFLAVGTSPAEAVGLVEQRRNPAGTGTLSVSLQDKNQSTPITDGRVVIGTAPDKILPAYPDEKGKIEIPIAAGS